jgi:hypothetical protein
MVIAGVCPTTLAALPSAGGDDCFGASGQCLYVASAGSDFNPGTYQAPFATLQHAQTIVRTMDADMTADIIVYLEEGTYRLPRPLTFGPQDSGTNGFDVVWTAVPGATVVISGAEQISGWKLTDPSRNIWAARVPASLRTRQMYVNGMRSLLDRGAAPTKLDMWWDVLHGSTAAMAHWRNPSQIDFVFSGQTAVSNESICPAQSIHGADIYLAEPCWENVDHRSKDLVNFNMLGSPTYVEDAYELLGQPGEFYLDNTRHVLYYVPRAGENMLTADVEVPRLQSLFVGAGTAANPMHNIEFSNLQFSYATWLQPSTPDGFAEVQANYTITGEHGYDVEGLCHLASHGTCPYGAWTKEPGNVQFSYDHDLTFQNDEFVHLGAAGLNLDNGSQDDTIVGSVFTDISGNGIEVGSVNLPRATLPTQTIGNQVVDNHVYAIGIEYHGACGILFGYAANSLVSHNQVDHVPYIAISMGWGGWLDKIAKPPVANFSHDNVVSYNDIFDYMQTLSDGGGVYTQGITGNSMANGEKVIGNAIHDELGYGEGIKSDDNATYVTYRDNALWNNSGYDSGVLHWDYRKGCRSAYGRVVRHSYKCVIDAGLVEDNWWQQGDASFYSPDFRQADNVLITGPEQLPAGFLAKVGIEPAHQSVLDWQPAGADFPNPPDALLPIAAFRGQVYLTWHPSGWEGITPVVSYTVSVCSASGDPNSCAPTGIAPITISAAQFEASGYAEVTGLSDSRKYRFMVAATNSTGSSAQSIPTSPVALRGGLPPRARAPHGPYAYFSRNDVALRWYRPSNCQAVRSMAATRDTGMQKVVVLGYQVGTSWGEVIDVVGHRVLRSTNTGSRTTLVIGDLVNGHKYRFTVAAVTPRGVGPASAVTFTEH